MRRDASTVVAALAIVVLLAGCGGEPAGGGDAPSRPAEDTPAASSPTGSSSDAGGDPSLFSDALALRTRQPAGLVQLDTATGEVVREFDVDLGQGASSLAYSPARGSVFFARTATAARQQIVERALDDGSAEVRAVGNAVAVAPDGERLAVARRVQVDGGSDRVELEVRTVDGQVLGRWSDTAHAEEPTRVSHLTWGPDGERLAFQAAFEDGTEVRTLETAAQDGSLHDRSRRVPAPGDLRMLAAPSYRPGSGRLAAVDRPGLDPAARQRWRVLTLEPDTYDVHEVLTTTQRAVTRLDFEDSGEHLLYVEGRGQPRTGQADGARPPELYRWHDDAATRVTEGVTEAAW